MSIEIRNLTYTYSKGTPFEKIALNNISLDIIDNTFVGLIGHTGSGKSTLIQHLNGILKPDDGKVIVNGTELFSPECNIMDIRKKVGVVFQYPEYQLFEETVYKDIAYGPLNLGKTEKETDDLVKKAIDFVGLDEKILSVSPFELSGGQKRRVAIAGVLAMQPCVLVLDEPTAGLDPKGRDDILKRLKEYQTTQKITVILSSHSMEDIAKTADSVIVMADGKIQMHDSVNKVFSFSDLLENIGLDVPQISKVISKLKDNGIDLGDGVYTVEEAVNRIEKYTKGESV